MLKELTANLNVIEKKYNEKWLKSFQGFENYSEKESKTTIKQLEMLADVVCTHFMNTS